MNRCGLIALVGQPNAGKSTLTNQLVGGKVSIVSPKIQTTRMRVAGVRCLNESQLVFIDTPGIFHAKKAFEQAMVQRAWGSLQEADIALILIDVRRPLEEQTFDFLRTVFKNTRFPILVLNKIDKVAKHTLLEITALLNNHFPETKAIFMISALQGDGIETILKFCQDQLPIGEWLYPPDQISDLPEKLFASELTREQLFLRLQQELPYSIYVATDKWEEKNDGSLVIHQTIYCQRLSHRQIILGAKGHQIKKISMKARSAMTHCFNKPVHLYLHVKVDEKWQERSSIINSLR